MNTTEERTMTLGEFLDEHAVCRVWWVSSGSPAGNELVLNTEDDAGEDYCDSQTLLEFIPGGCDDLEGTVTRDSDGEYRWGVDSLQDSNAADFNGNTILNLVVWGE